MCLKIEYVLMEGSVVVGRGSVERIFAVVRESSAIVSGGSV